MPLLLLPMAMGAAVTRRSGSWVPPPQVPWVGESAPTPRGQGSQALPQWFPWSHLPCWAHVQMCGILQHPGGLSRGIFVTMRMFYDCRLKGSVKESTSLCHATDITQGHRFIKGNTLIHLKTEGGADKPYKRWKLDSLYLKVSHIVNWLYSNIKEKVKEISLPNLFMGSCLLGFSHLSFTFTMM